MNRSGMGVRVRLPGERGDRIRNWTGQNYPLWEQDGTRVKIHSHVILYHECGSSPRC